MTTPRNDGLPELLNCPFCGAPGVRTLVGHADIQYFHCDERTQGCGAVVSFLPRKIGSSAFAAWSRRASPSVGGVRVPREVVLFLYGIGELDGVSFGEKHPTHNGKYWWRMYLQDAARLAQEDRLNPTAEVGYVDSLILELEKESRMIEASNETKARPSDYSRHIERLLTRSATLLRRLAGSRKEMK